MKNEDVPGTETDAEEGKPHDIYINNISNDVNTLKYDKSMTGPPNTAVRDS